MRNGRVLGAGSVAAAVMFLVSPSGTARADNVVADDQIVQGNLCVGTPCVNGEVFTGAGEIRLKGTSPLFRFVDTDGPYEWKIVAGSSSS